MVARRGTGEIVHARFRDLPEFLEPGDLLVVNNSATLPAALPAPLEARRCELRLSTPLRDGDWVVELRGATSRLRAAADRTPRRATRRERCRVLHASRNERLSSPGSTSARPLAGYLRRHGRPIRYPMSPRLADRGVPDRVRPRAGQRRDAERRPPVHARARRRARGPGHPPRAVTLHAGVSSLESGSAPYPERYRVPAATARLVNAVRGWGGRVSPSGPRWSARSRQLPTPDGDGAPGRAGRLIVTPERGLRAIDGLLTGWHEPTVVAPGAARGVRRHGALERSYRTARRTAIAGTSSATPSDPALVPGESAATEPTPPRRPGDRRLRGPAGWPGEIKYGDRGNPTHVRDHPSRPYQPGPIAIGAPGLNRGDNAASKRRPRACGCAPPAGCLRRFEARLARPIGVTNSRAANS